MRDWPTRGERDRTYATLLRIEDLWWLAPGLTAGVVVAVLALLANPFPGYDGGHVLVSASTVARRGVTLSPRALLDAGVLAPGTSPLTVTICALALEYTPVGPAALSRYGPALLTLLYLIPYYFLARDLLGDRRAAGVATMLFAVAPPVLRWHLAAGGLVRAAAFLLALTGAYATCRLFRSGRTRWLLASTLLFVLTTLTNPADAAFLALTTVVFLLAFDRSRRGVVAGAVVLGGGLVVAGPWLLGPAGRASVDALLATAVPRLGGGGPGPIDRAVAPLLAGPGVSLFFLLSFAGLFFALGRRRALLPAWMVAVGVAGGGFRFQFVAGAMLAAAFLLATVRGVSRHRVLGGRGRPVVVAAVTGLVLASVSVGVLYGVSALPSAGADDGARARFVDGADAQAMAWVTANTAPTAEFAVLGDAAEWFPVYTDRPTLLRPLDRTWVAPGRAAASATVFRTLSTCDDAVCVTDGLRGADLHPGYLYVPKGVHDVAGSPAANTSALRASLTESWRYRLVYENPGVAIFRVVSVSPTPDTGPNRAPSGTRQWGPTPGPRRPALTD